MKKSNFIYALALLALILNACSDDNDDGPSEPLGDYENGYFVVNEGPFQNGTGTITFVGDDGVTSQNVYNTVNGEDLGNIVNSMTVVGDKGYIVVNNSNRIVVVNRYTMEKEATITGDDIQNPRFMVASGGKGFISNWGDPLNTEDDFITVIDLESNSVLDAIPVGEGPEKLLIIDQKLFVCLQGGYGQNNKVVVIDVANNNVLETLTVGYVPGSLVEDNNGDLRVLCKGIPAWTGNETAGSLFNIDAGNYEMTSIEFAQTEHPDLLNTEGGSLYYQLGDKVYTMNSGDAQLPSTPIDGITGPFYSMKVNSGDLHATDAGDYASEGKLEIYNLVSGDPLQTLTTGIVPGQVVFP